MNRLFACCLAAVCFFYGSISFADTFGSGASTFEIEFVPIGSPGNLPDMTGQPSPAGAVPYKYRIGKYEISEQVIDKANTLGLLDITKDTRGPDKPATSVDWFEAAKFVNWLNMSTGHVPAYKFVPVPPPRPGGISPGTMFALWEPADPGYDPTNLFRNRLAKYFLPSMNEWYKAAFYDPVAGIYYDYPTGSNAPPMAVASGTAPGTAVYRQPLDAGPADIMQAGGLSPYGTMAQGGNVGEWEETALNLLNNDPLAYRGARGSGWADSSLSLSSSIRSGGLPNAIGAGFRVASVIPESSTFGMLGVGFLIIVGLNRRASSPWRLHYAQHVP